MKGFSLIELMVAILLSSVVIGLVSLNYKNLSKLIDRLSEEVVFREQYLVFLLLLEDDFQQAENFTTTDQEELKNLVFKIDLNKDNDFNDSGENIGYRWDETNIEIDRRSGKGSYQTVLDDVDDFAWKQVSTSPICYKLTIADTFNTLPRTTLYCRNAP